MEKNLFGFSRILQALFIVILVSCKASTIPDVVEMTEEVPVNSSKSFNLVIHNDYKEIIYLLEESVPSWIEIHGLELAQLNPNQQAQLEFIVRCGSEPEIKKASIWLESASGTTSKAINVAITCFAPGTPAIPPLPTAPPEVRDFSLKGDPNFVVSQLSDDARTWYERTWAAINGRHYDELAASDNLYQYGRYLHTHLQTLTLAFRATGDLKLLDEILRLSLLMKSQLKDSWRNTLDGSKQTDGYLNWVWRGYKDGDGVNHYGKDINMLDDLKTHSKLIVIIYMLNLNRELKSPAGYNYGKAADEWKGYFFNHFLKKWRERRKVDEGDYRVFTKNGTHTMYSITKLNYFLYKLTGDSGYLNEANYWADHLWADVKETSAPTGVAFVWPRSSPSRSPDSAGSKYLHPATYARYAVADMIEFHFEGYHDWKHEANMEKFARAISDFLLTPTESQKFAADIGGNKARAGYAPAPFANMTYHTYQISPYASIMAWDRTTRISENSLVVYARREKDAGSPQEIYIPVGMFIDALLN